MNEPNLEGDTLYHTLYNSSPYTVVTTASPMTWNQTTYRPLSDLRIEELQTKFDELEQKICQLIGLLSQQEDFRHAWEYLSERQ